MLDKDLLNVYNRNVKTMMKDQYLWLNFLQRVSGAEKR